jgi:hypothetical protein
MHLGLAVITTLNGVVLLSRPAGIAFGKHPDQTPVVDHHHCADVALLHLPRSFSHGHATRRGEQLLSGNDVVDCAFGHLNLRALQSGKFPGTSFPGNLNTTGRPEYFT